jgi:hypothetical protein
MSLPKKKAPTWQQQLAKLPPDEQARVIAVVKNLLRLKRLHQCNETLLDPARHLD